MRAIISAAFSSPQESYQALRMIAENPANARRSIPHLARTLNIALPQGAPISAVAAKAIPPGGEIGRISEPSDAGNLDLLMTFLEPSRSMPAVARLTALETMYYGPLQQAFFFRSQEHQDEYFSQLANRLSPQVQSDLIAQLQSQINTDIVNGDPSAAYALGQLEWMQSRPVKQVSPTLTSIALKVQAGISGQESIAKKTVYSPDAWMGRIQQVQSDSPDVTVNDRIYAIQWLVRDAVYNEDIVRALQGIVSRQDSPVIPGLVRGLKLDLPENSPVSAVVAMMMPTAVFLPQQDADVEDNLAGITDDSMSFKEWLDSRPKPLPYFDPLFAVARTGLNPNQLPGLSLIAMQRLLEARQDRASGLTADVMNQDWNNSNILSYVAIQQNAIRSGLQADNPQIQLALGRINSMAQSRDRDTARLGLMVLSGLVEDLGSQVLGMTGNYNWLPSSLSQTSLKSLILLAQTGNPRSQEFLIDAVNKFGSDVQESTFAIVMNEKGLVLLDAEAGTVGGVGMRKEDLDQLFNLGRFHDMFVRVNKGRYADITDWEESIPEGAQLFAVNSRLKVVQANKYKGLNSFSQFSLEFMGSARQAEYKWLAALNGNLDADPRLEKYQPVTVLQSNLTSKVSEDVSDSVSWSTADGSIVIDGDFSWLTSEDPQASRSATEIPGVLTRTRESDQVAISERPPGGIDFTEETINLQIHRDGGIQAQSPIFDLDEVRQMDDLQGFTPVIIDIRPPADLPNLLGLN